MAVTSCPVFLFLRTGLQQKSNSQGCVHCRPTYRSCSVAPEEIRWHNCSQAAWGGLFHFQLPGKQAITGSEDEALCCVGFRCCLLCSSLYYFGPTGHCNVTFSYFETLQYLRLLLPLLLLIRTRPQVLLRNYSRRCTWVKWKDKVFRIILPRRIICSAGCFSHLPGVTQ